MVYSAHNNMLCMDMIGVKSARGATPRRAEKRFPRHYIFATAGLIATLAVGLGLMLTDPVAASRESSPVEAARKAVAPAQPPASKPHNEPGQEQWRAISVKPGDNLSLIFQRAGLDDTDVYQVVNRSDGGKSLTRIFPGQTLSFHIGGDGELLGLRHRTSPLKTVTYTRQGNRFEVATVEREPEIHRSFASATVTSSLFMAGQDSGMSHNIIMALANIFGGVIDFVLDPRQGDSFHVLYEELYLDGKKLRDGNILAAEFINRGKIFNAFRYVDEAGKAGYFSEDGVSMRKAFLLAPVDFTRISSNFNPRRLHPIYRTRRPHRGTDYAAPRGTPVFASGDGRVIETGYTKANGNYVVVQHGEAYATKYLHLHRKKVRKGQRVKQNQIIGSVGSTGAATGPHLHYEFLVNGVHRNPRTIHKKLPKARSLTTAEMPRFQDQTRSFQMQLASIRRQQLALNNSTAE